MRYPDSFQVTTPTDCEIEITRDFHAPLQLVFEAFTKPELVRQWLLGPSDWSMPVCEIDLKVGGTYRYVWRKEGVPDMGKAASSARSRCPDGLSRPRSLTKHGIRARL
jgi:Activator of Hsp90 ATPase homolog 1-like protein